MTEFFHAAHEQDHNRTVSLLAQDQYMREVRWMTLADRQEEAQCIERIKRGLYERKQPVPNQWRLQLAAHARARLVETYQPLIIHLAKVVCPVPERFRARGFGQRGKYRLPDPA